MNDYLVIYEHAEDDSWSAQVADLPVYAVGDSRVEAENAIRVALALHLDELEVRGDLAPSPVVATGVVRL